MIVIHYKYWRQCDKTWQHRTKSFKFVRDAFGFCLSCKKRPNTYIESWACDDPSDNEWLWQHISLSEINRKEV